MDIVNNPPHYQGEVEAIDSIKASMSYEAFKGYCQGNALKYVIRYNRKNGVEDLQKAKWYINRLIKEIEKNGQHKSL
jgi:hypothetical protein